MRTLYEVLKGAAEATPVGGDAFQAMVDAVEAEFGAPVRRTAFTDVDGSVQISVEAVSGGHQVGLDGWVGPIEMERINIDDPIRYLCDEMERDLRGEWPELSPIHMEV